MGFFVGKSRETHLTTNDISSSARLASSLWPPTPMPTPEVRLAQTMGTESSFPAQQLDPDMEQMHIPREARSPGLGRDPRGCPSPARPSKGGKAWEPGPWRDHHRTRRTAIRSWQEEKTFFALIESREKGSVAGQANFCQSSGGGEQNPFISRS